jgi:hypothetical protein
MRLHRRQGVRMSGSRCQSTAVPTVEDSEERQRAVAVREEKDEGACK